MTERQRAVNYADKWFSLFIRRRDGRCMTCGGGPESCGHYITRAKWATRWEPRNAMAQCFICNDEHEKDPEPLRECIKDLLGDDTIDHLIIESNCAVCYTTDEIRSIGETFRLLAKEIQ